MIRAGFGDWYEVSCHDHRRAKAVAVGEENVHVVDATGRECQCIEVNRSAQSAMDSAGIDDQLVVDEDPRVIVADDGEVLPGAYVMNWWICAVKCWLCVLPSLPKPWLSMGKKFVLL